MLKGEEKRGGRVEMKKRNDEKEKKSFLHVKKKKCEKKSYKTYRFYTLVLA